MERRQECRPSTYVTWSGEYYFVVFSRVSGERMAIRACIRYALDRLPRSKRAMFTTSHLLVSDYPRVAGESTTRLKLAERASSQLCIEVLPSMSGNI